MNDFRPTTATMLVAAVCFLNLSAPAADWPQWRGPTRDGQLGEAAWPASLSDETLQQGWRVDLGPSYSGPIVVGDLVLVTETIDKSREAVTAFDRRTGKQRWKTSWPGAISVPFFAKANGDWIRSTPATDQERIYVAGMEDVLVCLDVATGDELWRRDFPKEFNASGESFGFVCSPLLVDDGVVVQCGAGTLRLDKLTGETVWRIPDDAGGMSGGAFSSPVVATLAGQRQLVVQTRTALTGVDLASGDQFWSTPVEAFRGMNILTPLVIGDSVFTCSYGGGMSLFTIQRSDDGFAVSRAWKENLEGYMSSPVLIDGFVYVHLKNQRLACIDPADGSIRWRSTPFGKYWSLVVNEDRLLALDERGELLLIAADPDQFRLLDRRVISQDPTWAHLAMSGPDLFVRELNALAVYRWE